MTLYSIGDSHCDYCFNGIRDLKVKWLGPRTMFRVGRDGLGLVDIRKLGLQNGDIAIWSFGEIDVRTHIGRICDQSQREEADVLDELVARYLAVAVQNRTLMPEVTLVISSVIPPSEKIDREDETLPFYGKLSDRVRITRRLNYRLRKMCGWLGFPFLDLYTPFADDNGALPRSSRADLLHLDRKFVPVVDEVLKKELARFNTAKNNISRPSVGDETRAKFEVFQCGTLWDPDFSGAAFDKAAVDTRSWFVLSKGKAYIPRIAYQTSVFSGYPYTNIHKIPNGATLEITEYKMMKRRKLDKCFLVGGDSNYYHTLIDHFCNLYFYEEMGLQSKEIPILIRGKESFQEGLARSFGFQQELVIKGEPGELLEFNKIYMPNKAFDEWGRLIVPQFFDWLRKRMAYLRPSSALPKQRIYISRKYTSQRRIENQDEIDNLLKRYDFTNIYLEDMTVEEQLSCFAGAEVVFGPHGAGFSNVIFASPGTKIIEIMPKETWAPDCFRYLAEGNSQNFRRVWADGKFADQSMYLKVEDARSAIEGALRA